MYLKTEGAGAPESKRVDETLSVRLKVKDGVFDLYNRKTKEKSEVKEIKIVPINDDRFTIKSSEGVAGEFVFSGIYRSAKQNIAVLKSSNGSTKTVMEGNWASIRDAAKAAGYKYTKLFYCLVELDGEFHRAIFDLQGIAAIQWGKIESVEQGNSITLKVSDEKNFETSGKKFYSMEKVSVDTISDDADKLAMNYADEVETLFESEDERYKYYKLDKANGDNQVAAQEAITKEIDEMEDINPEDIPF